jgi:hypothetical protein
MSADYRSQLAWLAHRPSYHPAVSCPWLDKNTFFQCLRSMRSMRNIFLTRAFRFRSLISCDYGGEVPTPIDGYNGATTCPRHIALKRSIDPLGHICLVDKPVMRSKTCT